MSQKKKKKKEGKLITILLQQKLTEKYGVLKIKSKKKFPNLTKDSF